MNISLLLREFNRLRNNLPTVAHIMLNTKCVQRCKTCSYWKIYRGINREIELEKVIKIIDDLFSFGVKRFRFVDTEPLLRKDIFEIVKHIKSKNGWCIIVTSGAILNNKIAEKIVESGLDIIRISIDGIGELHDEIRGVKGTYIRTIEGVKSLLRKRGERDKPKIHIFTVVSKLNFSEITTIKEKISRELKGIDGHSFTYVLETPNEIVERTIWKGEKVATRNLIPLKESLSLDSKQLKCLIQFINENSRTIPPIKSLHILDTIFFTRRRKCPSFHQVHIDIDANIIPCSFLQELNWVILWKGVSVNCGGRINILSLFII